MTKEEVKQLLSDMGRNLGRLQAWVETIEASPASPTPAAGVGRERSGYVPPPAPARARRAEAFCDRCGGEMPDPDIREAHHCPAPEHDRRRWCTKCGAQLPAPGVMGIHFCSETE